MSQAEIREICVPRGLYSTGKRLKFGITYEVIGALRKRRQGFAVCQVSKRYYQCPSEQRFDEQAGDILSGGRTSRRKIRWGSASGTG